MSSPDIVAIAGIAGTLLGVAIGSIMSWWINKKSIEHADKTRFHERKLETFAQFVSTGNLLISSFAVTGKVNAQDQLLLSQQMTAITLMASQPVGEAAAKACSILLEAVKGEDADRNEQQRRFNQAMETTVLRMRTELGSDLCNVAQPAAAADR
jgi:hypothetical protein